MPAFMKSCFALSALTLAASPTTVAASGFLAPDMVSRERVVDQLRTLLSHNQKGGRLVSVEEKLRPTYRALPKDSRGGLDHKSARYALYRYFLVHHGWHIKGLSMDAEEKGATVSTLMTKASMPNFIMDMLEEQVGHRVAIEELAVLAATIEDLVHSDAVDLVEMAYKTHGISPHSLVTEEEADMLIRTFSLYFLLPSAQKLVENRTRIEKLINGQAVKAYPGWEDAMLWAQDVKKGLEYEDQTIVSPFNSPSSVRLGFSTVARWATSISAGFGKFGNLECKDMKNRLLDLEEVEREDGRVRLDKFYGPYLAGGSFHFSESPEYLRHLGALDVTNARRPNVIIPNVMYSKSNCMATSGFHSVCCIDDCEMLMSDLEHHLSEPKASPAQIAEVVAGMPSETVAAPRNLTAQMTSRLDEIASRHGGRVPLHSRLFAQWMHYAFPNECPYPRSLLTSEAQLTGKEWSEARKQSSSPSNVVATKKEMEFAVEQARGSEEAGESEGTIILWSEDEELLSDLLETTSVRSSLASVLRWVAGAAVLLASLRAMADAARASRGDVSDKKGDQPWFGRATAATESRAHFV